MCIRDRIWRFSEPPASAPTVAAQSLVLRGRKRKRPEVAGNLGSVRQGTRRGGDCLGLSRQAGCRVRFASRTVGTGQQRTERRRVGNRAGSGCAWSVSYTHLTL